MARLSPITEDDGWFIGEDRDFQFTIYQPEPSTQVQNISGWALEWKVRKGPSDSGELLSKTTLSGITLSDPVNGVCVVHVARADTLTLEAGTLYHTLRRTDSGSSKVLSYGPAELRWGATR
jgi:hypothetical protein